MSTSPSPRLPAGAPVALSAECAQVRAELDALIDGELEAALAEMLVTHLVECEECRQLELGLRQLLVAVERSQIPVLASRRLRLRVAQHFVERESARTD